MKKKLIITAISALVTLGSWAQQPLQESNSYFLMPFGLSPAYSGLDGDISLGISYRNHWASVAGAPSRTGLLLGAAVSEKVGLGLTATNNTGGIFNQNNINFNYTYHIPFSDENKLSLSMQAGYSESSINSNRSNTDFSTDPLLAQRAGLRQSLFNAGAAAMFSSRMFDIGVYSPNLFGNQSRYEETYANNIDQTIYGTSALMHASFKAEMADGSMLRITGIGRTQKAVPFNYEFSAAYHIRQLILLGASVRQQGVVGIHGGYTAQNLKFMYSYEFPGGSISGQMANTHEVNLIISLPDKNLSDGGKKAKKEQSKIEDNTERIEKLNNNVKFQGDKIKKNEERIDALEKRADEQDKKMEDLESAPRSTNPEPAKPNVSVGNLGERISQLVETNTNMNKKGISATEKEKLQQEFNTNAASINDELSGSGKSIELIAGAFSKEEGAKKVVKQLKAKGVKATYFMRSDKKLYYITAGSHTDVKQAIQEKTRLNNKGTYTWLYVK